MLLNFQQARSILASTALILACDLAPQLAHADDIRQERVQFAKGDIGATIKDRIKGREIVDYKLGARAGQGMTVILKTDNASNYFNVMAPGETEVAFFIGSNDGNNFEGTLPESGDYTIRVYLFRNAARRGDTANYTLEVAIAAAEDVPSEANRSGSTTPLGDYADGLAGGPDFWEIYGVSSSLNIRSAPSTQAAVIIEFTPGTIVRNLGCQMAEGRKWCEVAQPDNDGVRGWAAGEYLRESSYVDNGSAANDDALVPGTNFNATGELPCARYAGQPTGRCKFGVVRQGNGTANVTVFWPDGGNRSLFFENGDPVYSDANEELRATKQSDLNLITIDSERIEISDAIIYGG